MKLDLKMLHRYTSNFAASPINFGSITFFLSFLSQLHFIVTFCYSYSYVILDQVSLSSPVLNEGELEALLKDPVLKPQVLRTFFDIRKGVEGSLEKTLYRLCEAADEAVRNGSQLLVLSDRADELVSTKLCVHCDDLYNTLFTCSL